MQCIPLATAYTAHGTLTIQSGHVYMMMIHHDEMLCMPHVKVSVTRINVFAWDIVKIMIACSQQHILSK